MSDSATLPGGISPINHSDAIGAVEAFARYFPAGVSFTAVEESGAISASGPVVIALAGGTTTISGSSVIDDASSGGNAITTTSPSVFFASANDTLSAASGSTTLFGASSGQMTLTLGGTNNSITGGSGSLVGAVAASNSTLIGGSGVSLFTVTGSNNLLVAGQRGTTGFDLSHSTGAETIATNPLGNSGKLVAILGSGADTMIGGGGASTVTAGSGSDVFAFVKGYAGGTEVIIGYNAKDNISFGGYGYTATNMPSETLTSAGDVITLTDGTTITLTGLDHKLFS